MYFFTVLTGRMAAQISQLTRPKTPLGGICIHQCHKARPILILFYDIWHFSSGQSPITSNLGFMALLFLCLSPFSVWLCGPAYPPSTLILFPTLPPSPFSCRPSSHKLSVSFMAGCSGLGNEGGTIKYWRCLGAGSQPADQHAEKWKSDEGGDRGLKRGLDEED